MRGKGENHKDEQFDEEKTGFILDEEKTSFILEDVQKSLLNMQQSTRGKDSEEDFGNLFEDMDLNSTKQSKRAELRCF